jgi:catechol 2,3-dioxygenase-like lactoylglutathione lyase family enzyme
MRILRIDHVSLNVSDRAESLRWYDKVLGTGRTDAEAPPGEPIFLGPDGAQVALFADRAPALRHVALLTDRVGYDEALANLRALGVEHELVPHTTRDSIYFADPDGHVLEVTTERA